MTRRVVVTGLGLLTGLGIGVDVNWKRLLAGESGIDTISGWDHANQDVHFAGEVKQFNPGDFMDVKEAKRMAKFSQFAVAATRMALEDSRVDMNAIDRDRFGCIVGTGIGGLEEMEEQITRMNEKGPKKISPFFIPKMMANAAGGHIAIIFGLRGPNFSCVSACASANNSMGVAYRMIQYGEADMMISGGTEAAITPSGIGGFGSMGALSMRNDEPRRASRPFDKNRDGFVMGEGAGILVFEELEHAKRRGAKIYAELLGVGQTDDAFHITAPMPEGDGAVKAMTLAMKEKNIAPSRVNYINAHGTSTPYNDKMESLAVKRVFGDLARKLAISSSKSMIGHLLGASSGAEMVITVKSVETQKVHPTINRETPDPDCDLDVIPEGARDWKIDCAISNSLGFGGHNTAFLIGRYSN